MNRATSLNLNCDMPRDHVLLFFLAGYYLFVLQHVTIFAKSDLRFSDKNIALQTKRSKSTKSFFFDISNLCSRPVSTDEILFNLFSDLHKLESFNLN